MCSLWMDEKPYIRHNHQKLTTITVTFDIAELHIRQHPLVQKWIAICKDKII